MQIHSLITLFCVIFLNKEVFAEGENEVKRGIYNYMAFLYYPDESVVDSTGARFLHGAVLIRTNWLVSAAVDHSTPHDHTSLGFPRKTLLARLGAISIDPNFTLNEDEDEQEREVIQLVRPSVHNVGVYYFTDITLLKTLLPFNMTSAVGITGIGPKPLPGEKTCKILLFAKRFGNFTEDKVLMEMNVELLPAKMDTCGQKFSESTMTCAIDSEETKISYDPKYCEGNSGGPLICDNEVVGLQTYVENQCKTPHLYQLLMPWETLISCATKDGCDSDYCTNTCSVTNKDPAVTTVAAGSTVPGSVTVSVSIENLSPSQQSLDTTQEPTELSTDTPSETTDTANERANESGESDDVTTTDAESSESSSVSAESESLLSLLSTVEESSPPIGLMEDIEESSTGLPLSTTSESTTTKATTTTTIFAVMDSSVSASTEGKPALESDIWVRKLKPDAKPLASSDDETDLRRPSLEARQDRARARYTRSAATAQCSVYQWWASAIALFCVL